MSLRHRLGLDEHCLPEAYITRMWALWYDQPELEPPNFDATISREDRFTMLDTICEQLAEQTLPQTVFLWVDDAYHHGTAMKRYRRQRQEQQEISF